MCIRDSAGGHLRPRGDLPGNPTPVVGPKLSRLLRQQQRFGSLSTEDFFYAAFALLVVPIARMQRAGLIRLLIIAAATSIAVPLMLRPDLDAEGFRFWAIHINPVYGLS